MFHCKKHQSLPEQKESNFYTMRPTAVREMLSSCIWKPNLTAVSTQRGKHRHGITGRKSVITSCRHWNANLISTSLDKIVFIISVLVKGGFSSYPCWSLTAPIMPRTSGQPCDKISPELCKICKTMRNILENTNGLN
jgi:hypothetical protein